MKVLVLNGSPKKKSDTFRMTEAFLEGLNRNQDHDIEVVNVIEKNISACKGCFSCWMAGDGHCVINDDQNHILDSMCESDLVIWSFPLYCYSMPSHLKAVLDRTIPLVQKNMTTSEDGTIRHEALADLSHMNTFVISGCGFPDFEGNFEPLREMIRHCFCSSQMVCVPEAPLFNILEAASVADSLLEKFKKAGEEFSANMKLSDKTIAELEIPMIPKENYLRGVNTNQ
ncbi:Flavodoxin-like fold [Lachnospiraceae bacterium]|nr:Flavodoxin-like fold [Lachnospiraceae bacterium]